MPRPPPERPDHCPPDMLVDSGRDEPPAAAGVEDGQEDVGECEGDQGSPHTLGQPVHQAWAEARPAGLQGRVRSTWTKKATLIPKVTRPTNDWSGARVRQSPASSPPGKAPA